MSLLDLEASGLSEWTHPSTAAAADGGSQQRIQAALIATMLNLINQKHGESDRGQVRKLEREIDEVYRAGILVASLLKSGLER